MHDQEHRPALAAGSVLSIAACKLLAHLYAGRHYGYFRDELYYLACSRHLDWGYVDQPPLIAVIALVSRTLFGDSLPAIRFLPALAGAFEVAIAALIARELGGRRFAQGLAALGVLVAPGILALNNLLTMNAFEPLFWMGCAWLAIRMVKTGNPKLWIWFGVIAGFGLENKYSILIFGAAVAASLILTPERRLLRSRWLWVGGAIALLIFLPNLIWNIHHHFPLLELLANIRRSGRDVRPGVLGFFGEEILSMNPLTLPLWLAGLWFFFGANSGKPFRALGWAWILTALVILTLSPRVYYLYPVFPLLFAGGAVVWEDWLNAQPVSRKFAWPAVMVISGVAISPLAIPVLPPETYIPYTKALHLAQPAIETHKIGPLPQIFADQFGWEEMAAAVARVYEALPPDIRAQTAIFAQNYGQAGAIDLFGPRYGIPPAISGHQSYFLWGPRDYSGASIILLGRNRLLEQRCGRVEKVANVYHPYSMPYEHIDIFYCRGLTPSLPGVWPQLKNWN